MNHWNRSANAKNSATRIAIEATGWRPRRCERMTKKAPPQTKNTPCATFRMRVVVIVSDMANATSA